MRFLHTADLHIDSAFSALGALNASERRMVQRAVLRRIFDLASREKCDMLLIAGDLFDSAYVTPETGAVCIELFEKFGKPIIISPGNHDAYTAGSFYATAELPENVFIFNSPRLTSLKFEEYGVTVWGYAFTSPALTVSPLEGASPVDGGINILCAHGELEAPTSRYAPVMLSDIRRIGFDYVALGHVHNPTVGTDTVRYCGFPEGRSFDELGEGGVLIVDIEDGRDVVVKKHTVSERKYEWTELSVDSMASEEELRNAITNKLLEYGQGLPTYLRLELVGTLTADILPDLSDFERREYTGIASLKIIDGTLCLPDKAYLEKDTTLRGEFYRSLRPSLFCEDASERAKALYALKIGLAAIDGKEFTPMGKEV